MGLNYNSGNLENITEFSEIQKTYTNVIDYSSQANGRQFNSFNSDSGSNKIVLLTTGFEMTSFIEVNGNNPSSKSDSEVSTQT